MPRGLWGTYAQLAAGMIIFGSGTPVSKLITDAFPVFLASGLRMLLAAAVLLPFVLRGQQRHDLAQLERRDKLVLALVALGWWGVGTMALGSVLWHRGVERVSGSTAAGFRGVMPVSALVLSYLLLGEPFVWVHLAGFAIVLASVGLIAWAHASQSCDQETDEASGSERATRAGTGVERGATGRGSTSAAD